VVIYMKAMIKVAAGPTSSRRRPRTCSTGRRSTAIPRTPIRHQERRHGPNLSPQNLECVETGKEFMLKHGYIKTISTCALGRHRSSSNEPPRS